MYRVSIAMDEEASGTSVVVENTRPSAVDAIASIVPSTSALSAFDLQTNSTSAVLKTIPAQLTDNIPGNSDTPSTANQPSSQRIADTADTDCDDDDENDQPLSDPEDDEFFFESDHLALRGNADYTAVLRTIAILQTQRMLVTKNIDILAAAESRALDDPVAFARQVKTGELQLPGPISVADLPLINFEKYGLTVPDFVPDDELDAQQQSASVNETDSAANNLTVRGRMFDQSKPETFNQLWTCDEQKRLEELLVEYPPEVVEMRRFAKIARALGNRTTKQVASRLQKFFKKLHSAGLPVPGRIPKSNRQNMSKAYRMLRQQAMRTTTFFPANHVPYNITDDLDDSAQLDSNWYRRGCYEGATGVATATIARRTYVVDSGGDDAVDEAVDENVLILRLAQRIKADKEREAVVEMGSSEHVGFAVSLN